MESHDGEDDDFHSIIENLVNMFGHLIAREVIASVVESFVGDLNKSVDAIMEITKDYSINPNDNNESSTRQSPITAPPLQDNQPSLSYASTVGSKGAVARYNQKTNTTDKYQYFWTEQIHKIQKYHKDGTRVMVIMRGVPGSGKTYLSKLLVEALLDPEVNIKRHIFSTDDYFLVRGKYLYDKSKICTAHTWNQHRVKMAVRQGVSPIIIDNTNIHAWEMRPYVYDGVYYGYFIEIVEPTTPWVKNAKDLVKRNIHRIPLMKIQMMLENYEEHITSESLLRLFDLKYSYNMVPPVPRLYPAIDIITENKLTSTSTAFIEDESRAQSLKSSTQSNYQGNTLPLHTQEIPQIVTEEENTFTSNFGPSASTLAKLHDNFSNESLQLLLQSDQNFLVQSQYVEDSGQQQELELSVRENYSPGQETEQSELCAIKEIDDYTEEERAKQKRILEAQKRLEELQKLEVDWDNGEQWDENDEGATANNVLTPGSNSNLNANNTNKASANASPENTRSSMSNFDAKPGKEKSVSEDALITKDNAVMEAVSNCDDWRYISLFMPPWDNENNQQTLALVQTIPIEKIDNSTCTEMHDGDLDGKYKVLIASSKDINKTYQPPEREKIPVMRMFDKSTMTHDGILISHHCPQQGRHFVALRPFVKDVNQDSVQYNFENCCGDAKWPISNLLGEDEYSIDDDDNVASKESNAEAETGPDEASCICLAKFGILPEMLKQPSKLIPIQSLTNQTNKNTVPQLKKKKRVVITSEQNKELKKQIEKSIVIPDAHYPENCLKIKKARRGENSTPDNIFDQPSTSTAHNTLLVLDSVNQPVSNINSFQTTPNIDSSDDETGSESSISESDNIVNINLGIDFIKELDSMFGRDGMEYPPSINYNISIPTSLLNEINALWMESMMFQFDDNAKKSAAMIEEDEKFARQLDLKQKEMIRDGKEPDVPDFKEIMDLELALNLHMKDVSEWRNHIPSDLAAKMTQDKLFNLFPAINKETLLEMLNAHHNNFKTTVETCLISTGREDILEKENGINKFVMEKEIERQEIILAAEKKKVLSESEWPLLSKGEKVDMETIQNYRDMAERHLNRRNTHMQQAEGFIHRGMTQVANYYSELANFHKTQYEQANSKAVATLMEYHAYNRLNGETVDLHFFRVKEAKATMDVFIDVHIQKLRETNQNHVTLYFITGRGAHSHGGPRVKPACIRRLLQRGLYYKERNPGLLRSTVTCHSKLTYEIP